MPSERARAILELTVAGQSNVDKAMASSVRRVNELKRANMGNQRTIDNHKRVQRELLNNAGRLKNASSQRVNTLKEEANQLRGIADAHRRNIKDARAEKAEAANLQGAVKRRNARRAATAEIAKEQKLLNEVESQIKANQRAQTAEANAAKRNLTRINQLHGERQREIDKTTDAMRRNTREIKKQEHAQRRLRTESQMGVSTMSQLAMVSGNVLIGVGGALTAGLYLSSRGILSYNTVLNETAAVSNATAEEIRMLDQQARQLGLTTEKSASEAAAGQRELGRAGFIVNETLAATPGVLALSTIGNIEMGRSAEYLAGTLRQFELEASMSNRVVDVFAQAVTSSLFNVEGLGVALGTAGPLAHQFNIPLERTVALLSTVRSAGVGPARTGTGLRSFFAAVANMSQGDVEQLAQIGVEAQKLTDLLLEGDIAGIGRILEPVGAEVLTRVFGTEAANVTAIISAQHEEIDRMEQVLLNASGAAEQMREVMNTGVVGAFREAKSAADGLVLSLGDRGLTGGLTIGADAAKTGLRFFDKLPGPFRTLTSYLVLAGPLFLGTGIALRLFAQATQHATIEQIKLNAANTATNIGLVRMKGAALGAGAALGGWGLGAMTGGVLALGVGLYLLSKRLEQIREAAAGAFDGLAAVHAQQVEMANISSVLEGNDRIDAAQKDSLEKRLADMKQALSDEQKAINDYYKGQYEAAVETARRDKDDPVYRYSVEGFEDLHTRIRHEMRQIDDALRDGILDEDTALGLKTRFQDVLEVGAQGQMHLAQILERNLTGNIDALEKATDDFFRQHQVLKRYAENAEDEGMVAETAAAGIREALRHQLGPLGYDVPTPDPTVVDKRGSYLFDRQFPGADAPGSAVVTQDPFEDDFYGFAEDVGGGRLQLTIVLSPGDPQYDEAIKLAETVSGGLGE